MPSVKALRRPDEYGTRAEPSDGEFVAAVIRLHARLHGELRALAGGTGRAQGSGCQEEDAVIRAYCAAYGVAAPEPPARGVCRRASWTDMITSSRSDPVSGS